MFGYATELRSQTQVSAKRRARNQYDNHYITVLIKEAMWLGNCNRSSGFHII